MVWMYDLTLKVHKERESKISHILKIIMIKLRVSVVDGTRGWLEPKARGSGMGVASGRRERQLRRERARAVQSGEGGLYI